MQIKMVGLDLDGTLLNSRKELTPFTKEVIAKAINKGVHVLVATGEILIEHLLSKESAKKALEITEKYDTLQEIYFDGQGYAKDEKLAHVERYHKDCNMWEYVRASRIAVPDIWELFYSREENLDKVQALFADMEERKAAWEELSECKDLNLVSSLKYNIEINAAGVNKGKGLIALGKMLGIEREEIMAIGDGDNDIEMITEAGVGVAMGNAEEAVKCNADYVTGTNDEDGAARAIVKYVLGGGEAC